MGLYSYFINMFINVVSYFILELGNLTFPFVQDIPNLFLWAQHIYNGAIIHFNFKHLIWCLKQHEVRITWVLW